MYCCLVATCNQVFWNDAERRDHLIQKHLFHPSYDFHNPKKFLKKFKSKLQRVPEAKSMLNSTNGTSLSTSSDAQKPMNCEEGVRQSGISGLNRAQRRAAKHNANVVPAASAPDPSCSTNTNMHITCTPPIKNLSLDTSSSSTERGDSMEVDDGLEELTTALRTTNIHIPSKISFGRRRGHHY